MTTSHTRWIDIPEVDNDFAKPFKESAFHSPMLSGIPTGNNKRPGPGTPSLRNWPEHLNDELPHITGGPKRRK